MRQNIKSISTKPGKFIPKSHAEDPALSEDAKEVKDRPLVIMWTKLTREDNYNISSLLETKQVDGEPSVQNLGTLARYIWERKAIEVKNVLLDDEALESVKGDEKNRLFNTRGMDMEIAEFIRYVQENSAFTEAEVKN